jgi:deoxyribonuclease IV
MLIGAHLSPAGGPANAVARGVERGCDAVQIFNQNPRAWKPTVYSDQQVADFRDAMESSRVDALLIHAVYLLNPASDTKEFRDKTRTSLIASLRAGDALGAHAVVLHPGSAKAGKVGPAIKRAGKVIAQALEESERCPLHLENTAGAGGTLGRSFEELAELIDVAGGSKRLGLCLDSCHLFASGFDIRTEEGLTEVLDDCMRIVGKGRLGSLHLNDSKEPLGSNRDRHADVGEGELGNRGCSVFLSEPRFQDLPLVLETHGPDRQGPTKQEITRTRRLRSQGIRRRS